MRAPKFNTLRIRSSCAAAAFTSGTFSAASASVRANAGPEGISLVMRSTSPISTRSVRATSRKAARAFNVPKVMIWPTDSRP